MIKSHDTLNLNHSGKKSKGKLIFYPAWFICCVIITSNMSQMFHIRWEPNLKVIFFFLLCKIYYVHENGIYYVIAKLVCGCRKLHLPKIWDIYFSPLRRPLGPFPAVAVGAAITLHVEFPPKTFFWCSQS
ncbi:hypothetical protein PIB30_059096 [Stylosanthes scabra]|uniref:Uncharacterized protein n=1 Tax=Stylosanthes scabra TaxID=79078 RepID=A0ABU6WIF5_9FABA|nr:hypothetical protein [Stylosanthes scabra]